MPAPGCSRTQQLFALISRPALATQFFQGFSTKPPSLIPSRSTRLVPVFPLFLQSIPQLGSSRANFSFAGTTTDSSLVFVRTTSTTSQPSKKSTPCSQPRLDVQLLRGPTPSPPTSRDRDPSSQSCFFCWTNLPPPTPALPLISIATAELN
ncbi:hypothetical protein VTJ04DRAFT_7957 [Mycothermus thermophilus]|uniref:uncharacterized protein n=1 Tax=Humicola insolens TaxID=85995 RepID=UPI0037431F03